MHSRPHLLPVRPHRHLLVRAPLPAAHLLPGCLLQPWGACPPCWNLPELASGSPCNARIQLPTLARSQPPPGLSPLVEAVFLACNPLLFSHPLSHPASVLQKGGLTVSCSMTAVSQIKGSGADFAISGLSWECPVILSYLPD